MMTIKAIELYNIMKDYTEEELKEIDIVIEPNRVYKNGLTEGYYVDEINEMYNQIRLIHVDKLADKHSKIKFELLQNELENTYPSSKFKIIIENVFIGLFYLGYPIIIDNGTINIIYTDATLHTENYLTEMFKICEKYLSKDMLFCTKILYDYLGWE